MYKAVTAVVLFSLFLLISAGKSYGRLMHSTPLERVDTSEEIVGAVGTYLPLVASSRQDTWVVIKVVSDQYSGCATPSGRATISGSYTVIQQLGVATAHHSGTYSWSQPNAIFRSASRGRPDSVMLRWLESAYFSYRSDGSLPQSATRYLICIVNEKATGQDKFTEVHLIPASWRDYVAPAVLYLCAHPKLSSLNAPASTMEEVRSLLHNTNPCLVLTGLQLLAADKHLTTADIEAATSSTNLNIIACSIALSRLYAWTDQDNYAQWMLARVAAIKSMNMLEGVENGIGATASAAMMLYSSSVLGLSGTQRLVRPQDLRDWTGLPPLVRKKLKELDPNGGPSDARWVNIDSICRQFGA